MQALFGKCFGKPQPLVEKALASGDKPPLSGKAEPSNSFEEPSNAKIGSCRTPSCDGSSHLKQLQKESRADSVSSRVSCEDSARMERLPADVAVSMGYAYKVHELGPPRPPCEEGRMATMQALGLINAPPDPELETILKLITTIFDAPTALVGLFEDSKVFITDATGSFRRGDFAWRYSFCGWTLGAKNNLTMVIPDSYEDARFSENPNVRPPGGGPGIRFYAGTPLVASNGHRLGTLCFADFKPRKFDACQCAILNNLASVVVRQIEKDIQLQMVQMDNKALYKQLAGGLDCLNHCLLLVDTSTPGFQVLYVNEAWEKLTGTGRDVTIDYPVADLLERRGGHPILGEAQLAAAAEGQEFSLPDVVIKGKPSGKDFTLSFRPATQSQMDEEAAPIGVPSFIPNNKPPAAVSKLYFITVSSNAGSTSSASSSISHSSMSSRIREAGEVLSGLTISHLLGKGSFGSVYAGLLSGAPVAVKIIEQDVAEHTTNVINMEASLALELRHPHIVATLEYFVRKTGRQAPNYGFNYNTPDTRNLSCIKLGPVLKEDDEEQTTECNGCATAEGVADLTGAEEEATEVTVDGSLAAQGGNWAVIDFANLEDGSESGESSADCSSAVNLLPRAECIASALANTQHMTVMRETVQTWIVMENCDKGCLQDAIDRGWMLDKSSCITGKPIMEAVMATAHEMACALAYLHSQDIIHGDLSAFNVLLTSAAAEPSTGNRGFVPKIADFGMARDLGTQSKIQTKTYGTLTHQPPETLSAGIISKAVDVYSFGVLLWQMYTSSRPWGGLGHAQIVAHVVTKNAKLHFPPEAPSAYAALAKKCMETKPEDRPDFETICTMLQKMREAH